MSPSKSEWERYYKRRAEARIRKATDKHLLRFRKKYAKDLALIEWRKGNFDFRPLSIYQKRRENPRANTILKALKTVTVADVPPVVIFPNLEEN